jgi:hypothetical protein
LACCPKPLRDAVFLFSAAKRTHSMLPRGVGELAASSISEDGNSRADEKQQKERERVEELEKEIAARKAVFMEEVRVKHEQDLFAKAREVREMEQTRYRTQLVDLEVKLTMSLGEK